MLLSPATGDPLTTVRRHHDVNDATRPDQTRPITGTRTTTPGAAR
jgi:hypothetical protein